MDAYITTITPKAACEQMRRAGIRITPETVRDGIEQKVFPFGDCIRGEKGDRRVFVYQRMLNEWMEARKDES